MISLPKEKEPLLRTLADLHDINNNRVFFTEWLKAECKRLESLNRSERDELQFRWRQGAIQVLHTLIEETGKAKQRYQALR